MGGLSRLQRVFTIKACSQYLQLGKITCGFRQSLRWFGATCIKQPLDLLQPIDARSLTNDLGEDVDHIAQP